MSAETEYMPEDFNKIASSETKQKIPQPKAPSAFEAIKEVHIQPPSEEEADFMALIREQVEPYESEKNLAARKLGGVEASADELFEDAVFGRDSLEVAEHLLDKDPKIAEEVIMTLAQLQGTDYDLTSEEEPGRIHHEYRNRRINGRKIHENSEKILEALHPRWAGEKQARDMLLYYGSIDATPLFARLIGKFQEKYPDRSILSRSYKDADGNERTIKESLSSAISWIENKISTSDTNTIDFHRTNAEGIPNQVWKDSRTSYIHESGELANHNAPIAPIEVQGYAYDALKMASELYKDDPEKTIKYQTMADDLKENILKRFWMEDKAFFAQGLDHDPTTQAVRQIKTASSNAALLMDTMLFDDMNDEQKEKYLKPIAEKLMSKDFLTDVGIRCRSSEYKDILPYQDYHGAWVVWTKDTYDIAKGFRHQGFHRLADLLETRIINGYNISGKPYEFYYVTPEGKVSYEPIDVDKKNIPEQQRKTLEEERRIIQLIGTNIPEGKQAWSASSVLMAKDNKGNPENFILEPNSWQYALEEKIMSEVPPMKLIKHKEDIPGYFPSDYEIWIKRQEPDIEKQAA